MKNVNQKPNMYKFAALVGQIVDKLTTKVAKDSKGIIGVVVEDAKSSLPAGHLNLEVEKTKSVAKYIKMELEKNESAPKGFKVYFKEGFIRFVI